VEQSTLSIISEDQMAIGEYTNKDMLKALKLEALKEYREYDGVNRVSAIFQANTDAGDGDLCLKTEFVYAASSARIVKKKESLVAWQSSWDI
jgi:hypothetical protein